MLPSAQGPLVGLMRNHTTQIDKKNAVRLLQASKEFANAHYLVPHN